MRAMPIQVFTGYRGWKQLKASFIKNRVHYLQEMIGLAIFMISACLFSSLLEAEGAYWHQAIPNNFIRLCIMGFLMGVTALLIFFSPFTAPSGSHINPAVTLTFFRLGKMCRYDALFYMICQFAGGTLAVYFMQFLLGNNLEAAPVNSVATVPGSSGPLPALIMEFCIAFITMFMVLFTSGNPYLKKLTRLFSACLVCLWVIIAGPISGFGMNPARSFASALPSGIWTDSWIYFLMPVAGMLAAAETYTFYKKSNKHHETISEIHSDTPAGGRSPFNSPIAGNGSTLHNHPRK